MSIKVQGQVVITDDKKGLFDKVNPGAYTTAERDALTPAIGDIVFNSQDEELQVWNGVEWGSAGSGSGGIGTPVNVLTPLDGAGVGGAYTFTPQTDTITETKQILDNGYSPAQSQGASGNEANGLVYHNGIYVLLCEDRPPLWSEDEGLTWTSSTAWPGGNYWHALTHNGNVFCAVGSNDEKIATSTDGKTWTAVSSKPNCNFKCIASNPATGQMVAGGSTGLFYSTNDGASWSKCAVTNDGSPDITGIAYGGGRYVAVSGNMSYSPAYSTNGTYFTYPQTRLVSNGTQWKGPIYDPDSGLFSIFWALANNVYLNHFTSSNGSSWTKYEKNISQESLEHVAYGNGLYVLIPYYKNYFRTSTVANGFNSWSQLNMFYNNTSQKVYRAFYTNNRWWVFATRLFRNPTTNFGSHWGSRNYNDQTGQDNHYRLTLAGTDIYDAADGSLRPDFTLEGVFTSGQGVSSSGDGTLSAAEYTNGSVLEIRAQGNFYVGDSVRRNGQVTEYGPSPADVEFTSSNAGTAPFNGTEATLAYRTWTLETRASNSDPWTVVTTADDYGPVPTQDGATPWSGKPTLAANTQYRVKVEYHSANARSVESDYNYFTTGDS